MGNMICDNCKNETICKHSKEVSKYQKEIGREIPSTPVTISYTCPHKEKIQKINR